MLQSNSMGSSEFQASRISTWDTLLSSRVLIRAACPSEPSFPNVGNATCGCRGHVSGHDLEARHFTLLCGWG